MVLTLVIATVAVLVLAQWYLVHRRSKIAEAVRSKVGGRLEPTAELPDDLLLHPGHTWARIHEDGVVFMGVSDFAAGFAGKLSSIRVPKEGQNLRRADSACTLVSSPQRHLDLAVPVEGKVLAVNTELLVDPELLQRQPYDRGWILCIRPRHLHEAARSLLRGPAAKDWLQVCRERLAGMTAPAVGLVAQDGGDWIAGFGDRLDDAQWHALRRELFPVG